MKRREFLGASIALSLPFSVRADAYPSKPIRYIVPVAAGGGNDMIARVVTERWGRVIGQTFVVENQSGGGGVIASQTTMRAAPCLRVTDLYNSMIQLPFFGLNRKLL